MKRSVSQGKERLDYILIRSQRRDVLFKALPEGETRVYAPSCMHLKDVDNMVRLRMTELKAMHRRLDQELEQNRLNHPGNEGSRICVEGRGLDLHLKKAARTSAVIGDAAMVLSLPEPGSDEAVRAAIRQTLSKRALERIRERLSYYAPLIGVEFGRVAIRDQKSRWGSCSAKHNLNFNWKLIMAPPEALDYVVIHELCHLIEFNHSRRFWSLVEKQMPEYEVWKKWLKTHGSELGV